MTDKLRQAAEHARKMLDLFLTFHDSGMTSSDIDEARDALADLDKALAEPNTLMTGWQPIETAPKDGRKLILLLTPSMWPQIAYSNSWWRSGFSVETKPTHWMPIPTIETKHGILGEFDK